MSFGDSLVWMFRGIVLIAVLVGLICGFGIATCSREVGTPKVTISK